MTKRYYIEIRQKQMNETNRSEMVNKTRVKGVTRSRGGKKNGGQINVDDNDFEMAQG